VDSNYLPLSREAQIRLDWPAHHLPAPSGSRSAYLGGNLPEPFIAALPIPSGTSARLPITKLIVAALAHSAPARTQQHLREVISRYEQWAAATVKSPAFDIVGTLRAFVDTRLSGALELVWFAAVVVPATLAAKS